ncbi:MAG: sulfatase-like hydrolase/transferase, partial [Chthoniobacteraceae bacterium]
MSPNRLRRMWWSVWLLSLPVLVPGACAGAGRPNILLIVTDDQRADTIHALGNERIETPNLDRLFGKGTVFTRAYAAYPICHVSRAEILTGCSAFRALPKYPAGPIDPALRTFAQAFREGGYRTWYAGKWHNDGLPRQRGYEATRGLFTSGGAAGRSQPETDGRGHPLTGYRGWTFKTDEGKVEIEKGIGLTPRSSEYIADAAIEFVSASKKEEPFFLHVNFTAPHDPRLWPAGQEHRYDPARIPLPRNFAAQ